MSVSPQKSSPHKTARPALRDVVLIGMLAAFGAFSIDLYLPALSAIAADFGADISDVQATMSAFLLGMAVGQLVFGPLSDRIGRRGPLLAGIAIYTLASIALTLVPTLELLVAGRFVQALGACAGMVIGRAIVRDRFDTTESARLFSFTFLIVGVAPMLAPSAGALILEVADWHMIFLVLAAFGLVAGVLAWRFIPESRTEETARQAAAEHPAQSYMAALSNRRVLGYVVAGGLNGSAMFTYLATSPALFMDYYGQSAHDFGLIFTFNAVGLLLATQFNRAMLRRFMPAEVARGASLLAFIFSLLLLVLALAVDGPPMWATIAMIFLILSSYGFVGANLSALALSEMPARAGVVSALIGSASFLFGALASAATAPLVTRGPATLAGALVIGLGGSIAAMYWIVDGRRR